MVVGVAVEVGRMTVAGWHAAAAAVVAREYVEKHVGWRSPIQLVRDSGVEVVVLQRATETRCGSRLRSAWRVHHYRLVVPGAHR